LPTGAARAMPNTATRPERRCCGSMARRAAAGSSQCSVGAIVDDARLFGRDWGFRLADVKAPVRWWHGDADHIVPLDAAQAAVATLPDAELILRPQESHLGGFATADEVLRFVRSFL
jgi:pimeloyl-ACP methyl ester carboxylesterase